MMQNTVKQRNSRNHQLRQTLADHLTQCIDIVGIITHDIAVIMGIKVADGQILHVIKHLFTHFCQGSLGNNGHQLRIANSGYQADHIHCYQNGHTGVKMRPDAEAQSPA